MTVKEFKSFVDSFGDNGLAIDVIVKYLSNSVNAECEIALQSAFDRLKELAWKDKIKRMKLEQQLKMAEMYLKGEMYSDEETARKMLYKQIANIEEILDDDDNK